MNEPLISIITPCLNRVQYIREAIESVQSQGYASFEHIIVDGGSTDGTLEILNTYPHLRVISESDEGMYAAINKGIRLARGEIVGLLNSDDLYAQGCFGTVVQVFTRNPGLLAAAGSTTIFCDDAAGRHTIRSVPTIEPAELWYRLIQGPPVTNAWFFRRQLFLDLGTFDSKYHYAADRYFLIRIALDGNVRPYPIHQVLYHYRQHSGSATITSLDSRTPEYGELRQKILREDLAFLDGFLARPNLPAEVRRRMRREHGERCYRLCATALYHHAWKPAGWAAGHGIQKNILWPIIFIDMAARRLRKELIKH